MENETSDSRFNSGGSLSEGSYRPELEEHAALLFALRNHLEGIQATVAAMTVSAAEGDEWAVEAVVPRAVLIHVPQTVLIGSNCRQRYKCNIRGEVFNLC